MNRMLSFAVALTLGSLGLTAAANNTNANCLACHASTPSVNGQTAAQLHALHLGKTARPEADCLQCHEEKSTFLTAGSACIGCHTDAAKKNPAHQALGDFAKTPSAACAGCHTTDAVRQKHLGAHDRTMKMGLKSLVSVDVVSARLIEDKRQHFAEISFRLLDRDGKPIAVADGDPANADWIKNLQLYINWGVGADFLSARGYSLFVKSNKRDIYQKGEGRTPAGERERTPLFATDGKVFTYRVGPVIVADKISGDRINDLGVISDRLIYCFEPNNQLISCDQKGGAKNAAWNHLWAFDKDGLVESNRLAKTRPAIVTNEKCGACHGYIAEHDETEINCRGCHSQKTAKNKRMADTTCFSGHDDRDGVHVAPRATKSYGARALPGFGGSTNDLTLPCLTCHNANTPPTQSIRERFTVKGQEHYLIDLILSHPDHKIWMHTLHAGTRPTAREGNSIRHVDYKAPASNCLRCHLDGTFSLDRLIERGRPLALDTNYDSDSNAHPAIDFKVNAYASPAGAVCLSCHAYKKNTEGKWVYNETAVKHMMQQGARFGVAFEDLGKEKCNMCHTAKQLKSVHGLN